MSEALPIPESECARVRGFLAQFVDDDVTAGEALWLRAHLGGCAECGAMLAGFVEIDSELTGWGQQLGVRNPPPAGAREQLAASMAPLPGRRRPMRWMPAAAAAIAAALVLAVMAPHGKTPVVNRAGDRGATAFVEIPFLPPLDPRENATVVRMNIRVATLIAVGY